MVGLFFGTLTGFGGLVYGIHLGAKYKSFDGVVGAFKRYINGE